MTENKDSVQQTMREAAVARERSIHGGMADWEIENIDGLYLREPWTHGTFLIGQWWWNTDFGHRSRRVTIVGEHQGRPLLSIDD